jgi:hypothetical protein
MDDWMLVDVIHGRHDAILELLFGCNTDVAQNGAMPSFLSQSAICCIIGAVVTGFWAFNAPVLSAAL